MELLSFIEGKICKTFWYIDEYALGALTLLFWGLLYCGIVVIVQTSRKSSKFAQKDVDTNDVIIFTDSYHTKYHTKITNKTKKKTCYQAIKLGCINISLYISEDNFTLWVVFSSKVLISQSVSRQVFKYSILLQTFKTFQN